MLNFIMKNKFVLAAGAAVVGAALFVYKNGTAAAEDTPATPVEPTPAPEATA